MTFKKLMAGLAVASAILAGVAGPARAEYPDHPIRLIYPFAPGGSGDALARLFANSIGNTLGQQMFVDNRPGAGGNIGFADAARGAPDGYTLLSVSPSFAINATLYTSPGFDPVKDFVAIGPLSTVPNVLVVNAASPFKTVKDLVDYARANPRKLTFGSSGIGTSVHLGGELLKYMAKIDMVHVPYRGAAQAATDLLGGQIDLMFDSAPSALSSVRTGKARALAIAATARLRDLPDVPTMAEAGYPDLINGAWTGIVAPVGTPQAVIDKVADAMQKATRDPAVLDALHKLGGEPFTGSGPEFSAFIKKEIEQDGAIVKATGMKVD